MRLTASDFYSFYLPEPCETRVFLRAAGAKEAEPSPYAQVLAELGNRFEAQYLGSLTGVLNLKGKPRSDREELSKEAVKNGERIIYQPVFRAVVQIGSHEVEVVGEPDFLIFEDGAYTIRDLKLARRITEKDHPEILRQLELYGWLFEKTFGAAPGKLEVYSASEERVQIVYDGGVRALEELKRILSLKLARERPYSPVGGTKCGACAFKDDCWSAAEHSRDIAVVYGVDQGLALALRANGVSTYDQLLERFDVSTLTDFKRPWGQKMQRVGKSASSILTMASSLRSRKEIVLATPNIPNADNYVMFDLEGIPPHLDELQKIYLWGTQVFGSQPGAFSGAVAECGTDGDHEGWNKFLKNAAAIFGQYGEIPFIHWHHYEKTNIELYIDRFGDPNGVAERVLENLVNLLPLVQGSIALPLPSYSLKVVEKYIGFKRTQSEFGGDWSIAKYIEAVETNDNQLREKIMTEILTYNREDLAATWAVFDWFRKKFAAAKVEAK